MAIIRRFHRPALPIRGATVGDPPASWAIVNPPLNREIILHAASSIGRIEFEGHPYLRWAGTGFLVAPYRLLTLRNIANLFCEGKGDVGLTLKSDLKAFLSSPPELDARFKLPIRSVRFLHPKFDVALCELGGETTDTTEDHELGIPSGLTLASSLNPDLVGRKVAVLGFAAADQRNDPEVSAEIYGNFTESLYLQAGELIGMTDYGGTSALQHDCSTMGGSGGAPLLDLESGLVLGIHYAGHYFQGNYAIPSWELARDSRVRRHGVIFSDDPPWTRQWIECEFAAAIRAEALARQNMPDAQQPPPPQPPGVDAEVQHLSQPDLYRVKDLLAEAGFAREDRQYLLFVSMNTRYVSMLPTEGAPDARLVKVLNVLNHTGKLSSGELPLRTLLFNAVENSKPLPASQKLQNFLDQFPSNCSLPGSGEGSQGK